MRSFHRKIRNPFEIHINKYYSGKLFVYCSLYLPIYTTPYGETNTNQLKNTHNNIPPEYYDYFVHNSYFILTFYNSPYICCHLNLGKTVKFLMGVHDIFIDSFNFSQKKNTHTKNKK